MRKAGIHAVRHTKQNAAQFSTEFDSGVEADHLHPRRWALENTPPFLASTNNLTAGWLFQHVQHLDLDTFALHGAESSL